MVYALYIIGINVITLCVATNVMRKLARARNRLKTQISLIQAGADDQPPDDFICLMLSDGSTVSGSVSSSDPVEVSCCR